MNSESYMPVKQITEFFFYSVIYRTNNTQFTNDLKQTFMTFFVALKNMTVHIVEICVNSLMV